MLSKEDIIKRLETLGEDFERYYHNEEYGKADQMYQRFVIVTWLLEMTQDDLKPVYGRHLFQMYKTDKALEKAGMRAVSLDPFGIRKRA